MDVWKPPIDTRTMDTGEYCPRPGFRPAGVMMTLGNRERAGPTDSFLDRHPDFQAPHAGPRIEFRTIALESWALEGLVARLG
jgi:hypothetical protein